MTGDNVLQASAPQVLGFLLANPGTVLPRFGFPVELCSAQVPAARVPLQDERRRGQRTQEEV